MPTVMDKSLISMSFDSGSSISWKRLCCAVTIILGSVAASVSAFLDFEMGMVCPGSKIKGIKSKVKLAK